MKKILLPVAALTIIIGATLFNSCTKDDTTAPVITLTGSENDVVVYKSATSYTDPGYSATDEKDGTITVVVTGTVDMNSAGEYTLTYTATDAAGNSASKTRTVTVNANPYLASATPYTVSGTYDGSPDALYVSETVSASTTTYNKIFFSKFLNYQGALVYATISGSTLTIPSQAVVCGTSPDNVSRTFVGSGSITDATHFTISGTVALTSTPDVTIAWSYTFTKN